MSYLTRPAMTESVDTLTGITTSGLPWTMALYDTEKEDILAAIEEPPYKQIWAEKISTYVYETDVSKERFFYFLKILCIVYSVCSWMMCTTALG